MRKKLLCAGTAMLAMAFTSHSALAQDADNDLPEENVLAGDYLTVSVGGIYTPSYSGSDDYKMNVFPLIRGKFKGVRINPTAGGVSLDLIDDSDSSPNFQAGPVIRLRNDRTGRIKDDVVKQLGELDTALEVGPSVGVTFPGILHGYDELNLSVNAKWDVLGAHSGMTISPSISYRTPLSRGIQTAVGLSADYGDDDYMDYYYSIGPAGSVASGLPQYQAKGGWQSASLNAIAGFDLDGDFTNGGMAIFVLGGYSRMLDDAKHSPITSIRGDADQWMGGAGIAYTF
ncbi:MipA/OmpV family protein [Altericroceibacterium spongiae]|uniref:MipA/OmpV family protein n=1 Tax=Altericroceibacterium spongiae TaxID=2320269 RepID=A0A420EC03_9SPHN|nr:MipA/OmpV family protein [Altericroceibacterium spongiae]RKF18201.1 MipA/OmpV family protein [Altericroceibacterium spongiae]